MKKLLAFAISLIVAGLLLAVLPIAGEEQLYRDVVRLHVLAASDNTPDQEEKLAVRDAVLAVYGQELGRYATAEHAASHLEACLPAIEQLANDTLQARGSSHVAKVTLCRENFHRRAYGDLTLPAGSYTSLQITLGEGEGQNWWCVLYPPLCIEAALGEPIPEEDYFTDSEYRLIAGDYHIRFRVLEVLEGWFG